MSLLQISWMHEKTGATNVFSGTFTMWEHHPIWSIPIIQPNAKGREKLDTEHRAGVNGAVDAIDSSYVDSLDLPHPYCPLLTVLKAFCILKVIPLGSPVRAKAAGDKHSQSLSQSHLETPCNLSVIRGPRP